MDFMRIGVMPPDQADEWREAGYSIANESIRPADMGRWRTRRDVPIRAMQVVGDWVVETPRGVKRVASGDWVTFDPDTGYWGHIPADDFDLAEGN